MTDEYAINEDGSVYWNAPKGSPLEGLELWTKKATDSDGHVFLYYQIAYSEDVFIRRLPLEEQ